jgi:hypothetical protein
MTRHIPKKIRVRIFVEERNLGRVWVPYKTLIGYTIPNRPILGRLWEQLYGFEEFPSRTEAIEAARRRAWVKILELFGHVDNTIVEWEVIHEHGPCLVAMTDEKRPADISDRAVTVGAATRQTIEQEQVIA